MKLSEVGQPELLVGTWAAGSLVPELLGFHVAGKGPSQKPSVSHSTVLGPKHYITRSPLAMPLEEK